MNLPPLNATLPQIDPSQNADKLLESLALTDQFSPDSATLDVTASLCQWQLLVSEYDLAALKAECADLEIRLSESVDEDGFNHLVELKKQIAFRERETARLQQQKAQAAS